MYRCALMIVMALVLARPAAAQNALGDGTGLQRDTTNYGPNARPPAQYDIMQSIRFRNAVVTGNVPMGKHFRGDADGLPSEYAQELNQPSPFEFRGAQGEDSTFAFRRDSLFSGMAGTGIRGTDALQYQLAITTATAPPPGFAVDMLPQRGEGVPSAGATLGHRLPAGMPYAPSAVLKSTQPNDPDYDPRGRGLQDLRSTSSFRANQSLQTELHMQQQVLTGDIVAVTSSELRGVRLRKLESGPESPYAAPSLEAATQSLSSEPLDNNAVGLVAEPVQTGYDRFMAQMRERAESEATDDGPTNQVEALEARLTAMREQLAGRADSLDEQPVETSPITPEQSDGPDETEDETPEAEPSRFRFDPATIKMIKETGDKVESFAPVGKEIGRNLYAEHMKVGEQLIGDKRFFDAEARFTAALSVRPGDPMASIGRVHAQLGAGMFESAAINLRQLLAAHPEVAGIRYADALLPTPERRNELVHMLRTRRDKMRRNDPGIGLLVAYIGYQSADPVVLRQGLDILTRAEDERAEQRAPHDPVSSLVVEIWTPGK